MPPGDVPAYDSSAAEARARLRPVDGRDGPFLLRGAASDWPARLRWTRSFLLQNYGDHPVDVVDCENQSRRRCTLGAYLQLDAEEASRWYVVDWNVAKSVPELAADIRVPDEFSTDWIQHIPRRRRPDLLWIYIGHGGTHGTTHVDAHGSSAWLAVLEGVKVVRMLGEQPRSGKVSSIDLFDPGTDGSVLEARLQAGYILYIPAGTVHAARNDTYCLSVTGNFVDGPCFGHHRSSHMRQWYGHRMLAMALDDARSATDDLARAALLRHVAIATESLEQQLTQELAAVKRFRERLEQT